MLAINTQLSGLIMWNCGKFTWGSGTNDIRVWPCVSEMAPAPAAGTPRLPKKIWSHSVPHVAPPLPLSNPSPFPISLSLFPFPSLKFANLSLSAPPFVSLPDERGGAARTHELHRGGGENIHASRVMINFPA